MHQDLKKIKIEPHLGSLTNVSGEIPHPDGKVAVAYKFDNNKWHIQINLPQHTEGLFVWKGKEYSLHAGQTIMQID